MGSRGIGAWATGVALGMCALTGCGGDDVNIASVTCGQLFQAGTTTQSRQLLHDVVDEVAATVDAVGYADMQIRDAVASALRMHCENVRPQELAVSEELERVTRSVLRLTVIDSA